MYIFKCLLVRLLLCSNFKEKLEYNLVWWEIQFYHLYLQPPRRKEKTIDITKFMIKILIFVGCDN